MAKIAKQKFGFFRFTRRNSKGTEAGRSMMEILGVLAIIGVLTIGALSGYNYAMKIYRVNEIVEAMNRQAVLVSSAKTIGVDLPEDEWNVSAAGLTIEYSPTYTEDGKVYDNFFTLTVKNVPKELVEMLIQKGGSKTYQILIDGIPIDEYDFKNYRRIEKVSFLNIPLVKPAYAEDIEDEDEDTVDVEFVYDKDFENLISDDECYCEGEGAIVCSTTGTVPCPEGSVCMVLEEGVARCTPLPECYVYFCPVGDGWEVVDDDSGNGGGSGSGNGNGGNSGHNGGSGSGSGLSCKSKYLSPGDPKCDPCKGKECACGCDKSTGNCYEEKVIQTGKCCNEGEDICCPQKQDCPDCVKDSSCTDCPEDKPEGSVWCCSDSLICGCSNGSILTEDCTSPDKCYSNGNDADCENPCDHLECGECGCNRETGECYKEIPKLSGPCCDNQAAETCCEGSEGCECVKTEECECECDPPCVEPQGCVVTKSSSKGTFCSCWDICVDESGDFGMCDPAECQHCVDGKCEGCEDGKACKDGECVDCDEDCCEGAQCPVTCQIDPERCSSCKNCCDFIDCPEGQHCVCTDKDECKCENDCTPGEIRCYGIAIQKCREDGKGWDYDTICEPDENGCPQVCSNGECVNNCTLNGKLCCDNDFGGKSCIDNQCNDVTCKCGECDPCTGKCNPPDEECPCECSPACSGSQVCVHSVDDNGKGKCECKETCGEAILGPCEECKPDPLNPEKMVPTQKCDVFCQECVNNACVDMDPLPEECHQCPEGTVWIDE